MSKFLSEKKQLSSVDSSDIFWKKTSAGQVEDNKESLFPENFSSINFNSNSSNVNTRFENCMNKEEDCLPNFVDISEWNDIFNFHPSLGLTDEEVTLPNCIDMMIDGFNE